MDVRGQLQLSIANRQRASNLHLAGADLAGGDLSGLHAERLDLSRANLQGVLLRDARLGTLILTDAILLGSDAERATFRACTLDGVQASGALFDAATLEDSSAKGADFNGASLRGASLSETCFDRAVLSDSRLDGATGAGVGFRGADLAGASLVGAQLDDADFRGADLTGADLSKACLSDADFRGAIIERTCFDGADLTRAMFDHGVDPRPDAPPETGRSADTAPSFANFQAVQSALAAGAIAFAAQLREGADPAGSGQDSAAILGKLQESLAALDRADGEPPEEWKGWLEPLMHMTRGERPFDLKVVFDAMSSFQRANGADEPAHKDAPPST